MKHRHVWAGALALAMMVTSTIQTIALTNGLVVIVSRTASDALYRQISSSTLYDADDYRGPGTVAPGDAEMAKLLGDYGYGTRLIPERLLWPESFDPYGTYTGLSPEFYYGGGGGPSRPADTNYLMSAQLVIVSGAGSSADMPPVNTNNIPIIMGEHSCVADVTRAGRSSLYMYDSNSGGSSAPTGDSYSNVWPPANPTVLWMKVTAAGKTHPIMQGIPLDAADRVKIWRDRLPEENAHLPTGGKPNWNYTWLRVTLDPDATTPTVPAPGTTVIGLLASDNKQAVFAVMDAGGTLAPVLDGNHYWYGRTTAPSRLVHLFVNERGSGESRRGFNCLTDLGKVIFIRTCKWAMGESLQPYQGIGLIQVSKLAGSQIQLAWTGLSTLNYKVVASANLLAPETAWQTVAQDIPGSSSTVKLDISAAPQYAFLKVSPMP